MPVKRTAYQGHKKTEAFFKFLHFYYYFYVLILFFDALHIRMCKRGTLCKTSFSLVRAQRLLAIHHAGLRDETTRVAAEGLSPTWQVKGRPTTWHSLFRSLTMGEQQMTCARVQPFIWPKPNLGITLILHKKTPPLPTPLYP